jgi:hypothetical protein
VIDTFLEAGDEAGLRDRLPPPEPRRTQRPKDLPANVVALDAILRQRAAE